MRYSPCVDLSEGGERPSPRRSVSTIRDGVGTARPRVESATRNATKVWGDARSHAGVEVISERRRRVRSSDGCRRRPDSCRPAETRSARSRPAPAYRSRESSFGSSTRMLCVRISLLRIQSRSPFRMRTCVGVRRGRRQTRGRKPCRLSVDCAASRRGSDARRAARRGRLGAQLCARRRATRVAVRSRHRAAAIVQARRQERRVRSRVEVAREPDADVGARTSQASITIFGAARPAPLPCSWSRTRAAISR